MTTERATPEVGGDEPTWLDGEEKAAWTSVISLIMLLPGRLEAPLQQAHGITLFEYLTLSHLSEAPGRRLRMSELAFLTNGSLSRLSNVVKRLEGRGWMHRSPDPDDGRYTLAALTDAGFDVVHAAAPTHLRAVRDVVLDRLDAQDRAALGRIGVALGVQDFPPRAGSPHFRSGTPGTEEDGPPVR
ncbi:Transcriptional regulator, MarR family [Pseudonocardia sp. Ae406_Ps2]|uniref:MarR family winged helix-turn-helix transcriptional regulator n=1 Tax=unclassified Pseudonocardia TaxID=2619320 RepID=UPI0009619655|nr:MULTISPECIES: MarR family transcriptional regulator [unclassified Pseudonocardia]OLM01170.1 Transcriptional regulator, MarR family [Pseudonocardia sp. Ae406_Ps2]OLM07035.1 Transcriptional regulator, MarR family [Pseudonocardia sp. Ae331_Ps2]OLM14228.1 Transcriptional regulator, MarR family [Pseudonocardia sp. Ae505_Ps2]OLM22747.1 Transcriptional regulator, MarR family [Pseudonocardia sp. Ae706_Ps2]OLM31394.1 Transcriptional regulator, MarR family [Pseudonocardia sp. Ae717_Ps2]